ncbi:class A beta-lactamase [Xylophilus sp. GOD-11R]|uniref:class A beta-lactamase n=1 Tax=Xylophilus sp. GOD-11R TaxID=3089814 RepID=UPI00298C6B53|nr:class A beta-lactamase [Xylophilus sp. GOD-11R]WPB57017.1 class A beta-lactamase [Xylophilus sp. GOD-11R]
MYRPSAFGPTSLHRRWLVASIAALVLPAANGQSPTDARLAELETNSGGRLGVVLLGPEGVLASHRAQERFPACSTFKVLLAAAVLHRAASDPRLLNQLIRWDASELHTYAPVTSQATDTGLTVRELCAATIQYSDNVAANLLMRQIGGPAAVTAFARYLGDTTFRLDRWEPELNTAVPGDMRDTCTPADMARNLQRLSLGRAIAPTERRLLDSWLLGNTTGGKRIRAGTPADWTVGDKTGTGEYGTANDIAVIRRPKGKPLILTVFFTQPDPAAKANDEVVAEATRRAFAGLR